MRYIVLAFFLLSVASCETDNFNADKRQIMAKDYLRATIGRGSRGYDVISFREDTLTSVSDSFFKRPIQYTLDYIYNDSTGNIQNKRGTVVFAPDGKSIIGSEISDRK